MNMIKKNAESSGFKSEYVSGWYSFFLKFIYSEKAPKFCEIFTLLLSYVVPVKSEEKILQNFAAFSEYMNFTFNGIFVGPTIERTFKHNL